MTFDYQTQGTCCQLFRITVENNIVKDVLFSGGCMGNLSGISSLVCGMHVDDVIKKLEGIKCGNKDTSCPDQLANALKAYKSAEK